MGAMWTAAGAIAVLAGAYVVGTITFGIDTFTGEQFIRRSGELAAAAALVGYLGTYSHPLEGGVGRVALWPRKLPRNSRTPGVHWIAGVPVIWPPSTPIGSVIPPNAIPAAATKTSNVPFIFRLLLP